MKAAAIARAAKSVRKDLNERTIVEPAWVRASGSASAGGDAPRIHMTPREREVLALLCEGLPNKLIARRLRISAGTVKVHVSNLFRALNVSNRLQAVLLARSTGIADDAEEAPPHNNHRHTHR